jgi:predicted transcriptional regulator
MTKKIHNLGELESMIMSVVWEKREVSVQDVKDILNPTRPLAYTTVMTVMSRLAKKGLLNRRKEGRAHIYSPGSSQEKLAGSLLRSLVDRLYDGASGKAIAHLLESDETVDEEELERLEKLIQARKKK